MIRITRKLETETLHVPELRDWIGRTVEITVLDEPVAGGLPDASGAARLRGTVVRYIDPFEPTVSPDDWEAQK